MSDLRAALETCAEAMHDYAVGGESEAGYLHESVTWASGRCTGPECVAARAALSAVSVPTPDGIRIRRDGTDVVVSLRYGGDSTLTDALRFSLLEPGADHMIVLPDSAVSVPTPLDVEDCCCRGSALCAHPCAYCQRRAAPQPVPEEPT